MTTNGPTTTEKPPLTASEFEAVLLAQWEAAGQAIWQLVQASKAREQRHEDIVRDLKTTNADLSEQLEVCRTQNKQMTEGLRRYAAEAKKK